MVSNLLPTVLYPFSLLYSLVYFFLQTLSKIFKSGYSRIPVYGRDTNDIVGLILTKDLIFLDPEVSAYLSTRACVSHCLVYIFFD